MGIIFVLIVVSVLFFIYEIKNSPTLHIDEHGNSILIKKKRKSDFPFNPMSNPYFEERMKVIEWVDKIVSSSKTEEQINFSKNLLNNLGILIHLSIFELPLERKEFNKIRNKIYEIQSKSFLSDL